MTVLKGAFDYLAPWDSGTRKDQRYMQGLIPELRVVLCPAVFVEFFSVVAGDADQGLIVNSELLQLIEHSANSGVRIPHFCIIEVQLPGAQFADGAW